VPDIDAEAGSDDDDEDNEDAPKQSLNDFLNAGPEEEKKGSSKPRAPQPKPERVLTEDDLKKREENRKRLEDLRRKREIDAARRAEAANAEVERTKETERLQAEMKTKAAQPKKRKNRMFW